MITGFDYVFYSTQQPNTIEHPFLSALQMLWEQPIIEEFERTDNRLELFFAKNQQMYAHFDEIGYALDQNNEGCFMLIANLIEQLKSKAEIVDIVYPASRHNTEPYEAMLSLNHIWEYTLVLPTDITDNLFSNTIYAYFEKCLSQNRLEK